MIRDITAFHRRAFIPSRTTVIAVGDATHDALVAAVQRAFEGWTLEPSEPIADPDAFPAPPAAADAAGRRPPRRARRSPSCASATSRCRAGRRTITALLVANMILGGQFVSRINMNLREDKGYTYGARTAFEFRRAPGPFVLHASVQPDATADALREALGEIRAIRGERPVTARGARARARRR